MHENICRCFQIQKPSNREDPQQSVQCSRLHSQPPPCCSGKKDETDASGVRLSLQHLGLDVWEKYLTSPANLDQMHTCWVQHTHTRSGSSMMSLSFPDASHWKCDDGRVPIMDEKDFQRYFRIFVCSEVKSSDCNGGISVQENLLEVLRWLWIKRCNLIPEHVLLKEPSSLFFFRKVLISQGFARSHAILCEACFFLYRGTSKSAQK